MKKVNVGIIGLGTIGSGVYKILNQRKSKIKKEYHIEIDIKKCCDISEASRKRLKIPKKNFTKDYNFSKVSLILFVPSIISFIEVA